jgi:hypothetical protein
MLSREDFDSFERRLRLRRRLAPLAAALVLMAALGGAWRTWTSRPLQATSAETEREPNESPATATRIAPGVEVRGTMGASSASAGDRDLFVTTVATSSLRVTLSGIDDLNLTLEVLQPEGERLRRRVFLDDVGPGGAERVDALAVTPGEVYLRVEEKPFVTEPNRPARERALVPYTLRVDELAAAATESEPNDTAASAQALPLTRALQGYLGANVEATERAMDAQHIHRDDAPLSSPDWFRVDDDTLVVVVPPERGALELTFDEPDARRPRLTRVEGAPAFLPADGWPGARPRRVRVTAGREALPGDAYFIAAATAGENGVAGLIDLAARLREAGREATRRAVLEGAARQLPGSPERARLAP